MNRHTARTIQPQRAVIYCRVSSKRQVADGSGLESQEHRCRDYAAQRGYVVDAVFPDDVSGGGDFMKRPGMVALLAYLDAKPDENYIVIFDDLKRYARDTEFHLKLRRIMAARGAMRECLNFRFEDTPEGKFIETMLAAQGELEREQNGRQVVQKMKARLEQGLWVFKAPLGYRYAKSSYGGKQLIPDEPIASVITEALEGFAAGRFQSQVELQRFLEANPLYPKDSNGGIHSSRIRELLERPVYAGYIEAPNWNVSRRKGRHEGLITYQTYLRNQERLKEGAHAPARKDNAIDFPLRGSVTCADCGHPLTACWSKGKKQHHPYYLCHHKGCESYGKSIRRAALEGEFESLLKSLQPTPSLAGLLKVMIEHAWAQRLGQAKSLRQLLQKEIRAIENQIDGFLDRLVETDSPAAIKAYERKIATLEQQKMAAQDKLENGLTPKTTIGHVLEHALSFISNPWNLWRSGDPTLQKLVLRLTFSERLAYCRNNGLRTPKTTLPFKVLASITGGERRMVELSGIEPLTSCMPCKRSPS
jgi:site-specific DNA recombinase